MKKEGSCIMAENFRIIFHRNSESLHLKLFGDFDENSSYKLLKILKKNAHRASKIFIHTTCLNHIHPLATKIFQDHLNALNGLSVSFLFTGKDALQLVPKNNESCRVISG